jgi:hypothetical protein
MNVDHRAVAVRDEEALNRPRLDGQGVDDRQAASFRLRIVRSDVLDLDRDVAASSVGVPLGLLLEG